VGAVFYAPAIWNEIPVESFTDWYRKGGVMQLKMRWEKILVFFLVGGSLFLGLGAQQSEAAKKARIAHLKREIHATDLRRDLTSTQKRYLIHTYIYGAYGLLKKYPYQVEKFCKTPKAPFG